MADFLTEYIGDLMDLQNAEKVEKTGNTAYSLQDEAFLTSKLISALAANGKSVVYASENAECAKEVYKNLPEKLKKRTVCKDADTEGALYELKNLKKQKSKYIPSSALESTVNRGAKDRVVALKELNSYFSEMYESEIAEGNYYDALDRLIGTNLPSVNFTEPEKAVLSKKEYVAVKERVREACEHLTVMGNGGKVVTCPWYGAKNPKKADEILSRFSGVCRVMENVLNCLDSAPDNITLVNVIAALADNVLEKEDMQKLLSLPEYPCGYEKLEELINAFNGVYFEHYAKFDMTGSEDSKDFENLLNCGSDESVKYSELKKICENSDIFVRGGKYADGLPFDKLLTFKRKIDALNSEREKNLKEALSVFDKLEPEKGEIVLKAYEKLKSFHAGGRGKPGFFDFGAKSAYKKLCAFSSVNSPSFDTVLGATYSYNEAAACKDDIAKLKHYICRIMARELADPEFESLNLVLERFEENNLTGLSLSQYLIKLQRANTLIKRCAAERQTPKDYLTGDFIRAYKLHLRRLELKAAVDKILNASGFEYEGRELPVLACSIALVMRTAELFGNKNAVIEFHEKVRGYDKPFMNDLMFIVNELINLGRTYFQGYYTRNPFALTLSDLKYFVSCAEDRCLAEAATGYHNAVYTEKALHLEKFFEPFILGDISAKQEDMLEIFENSYYKLAVENKRKTLGKRRAGFGKHSCAALDKLYAADCSLAESLTELAVRNSERGDLCFIFPYGTADMLANYDTGVEIFLLGKGKSFWKSPRNTGIANDVKKFVVSCGIDKSRVKTNYSKDGVNASVAVLSKDLSTVALAIWCERPTSGKAEYIDYAVREYNEIAKRGIAPYRVFIHDWYDNVKNEKAALGEALEKVK